MGRKKERKDFFVVESAETKLYYGPDFNWVGKILPLQNPEAKVRILTYSLWGAWNAFFHIPNKIYLVCHSKFKDEAIKLKEFHPQINIATHPKIHAKVVLIEPELLYVSSCNFAGSDWHETTISIRSKESYDNYLMNAFQPLWRTAEELR